MKSAVTSSSPIGLSPTVAISTPAIDGDIIPGSRPWADRLRRAAPARGALEESRSAPPSSASIIASMGLVLGFTVIGDAVAENFAVPVPGAAIGMLMLAGVFAVRGAADPASGRIFDVTAPHIPLFFVPAAAGIVADADLLTRAWLSVCVAIVLGTAVTLIATGTLTPDLAAAGCEGRNGMNSWFSLLQAHPLFGVLVTVVAYTVASKLWRQQQKAPSAAPRAGGYGPG